MDALEQLLADAQAGKFTPPGTKRRRGQIHMASLPKPPLRSNSEALEERAAILEFDAGLSREEADFLAPTCIFWKVGIMQQSELLPPETVPGNAQETVSGNANRPLVVHLKKAPFDVRVDRGGPWGNPFELDEPGNPKDGNRAEAPAGWADYSDEQRRAWLQGQMGTQVPICAIAEMVQPQTVPDTATNGPTPAHALLVQAGVNVVPVRTKAHAADVVAALCALPDNATPWGLDIETTPRPEWRKAPKAGLCPHKATIRTVQVYPGGGECFVFDVGIVGLPLLEPLWNRTLVAHNAVFELKFLLHTGANPARLDCTLLQANTMHGTRPSLADLSADVLGWKLDKALQLSDFGGELSQAQLDYAALDAVAAFKLAQVQAPALGERAQCYGLMRDAQRAIARLELAGCPFDVEAHGRLMAQWRTTAEAARYELDGLMSGFNPDSPQQLSKWLAGSLPADVRAAWPRTAGGSLKTNAETLSGVALPALEPLARYKTARKMLSTYGVSYVAHINPVTGRLHPSFLLGGTATGRLSCQKPNIHNPPRGADFRALFAPAPGRVFVVADYSQIELRVAAVVSGDAALLAAYVAGEDLHRKTAGTVLKKEQNEVTKGERRMAKAVNFGLLFGQGTKGLQRYAQATYGVTISLSEADKARRAFFHAYPGLSAWQTETRKAAERAGQVRTPGGRVRQLEGTGLATECLNTPIQGGAAEVLLATLALLEPRLVALGAVLVNTIHDELVVECNTDKAAEVAQAVEAAMVAGFRAIFPDGSTRDLVEARSGPNWAAAKG